MCKALRVLKTQYFDIFFGEGWKNWTRVKRSSNGRVEYYAGAELTPLGIRQAKSAVQNFKPRRGIPKSSDGTSINSEETHE